MRICHITTVHPRFDVRIWHKQCISLAKEFKDVHLIVADGVGDDNISGIQIHDIGKPSGRKERFLKTGKIALAKALSLNADIYHIHDPELLRIALKLKRHNAVVFYDSHEDLPRQILNKPYIPKLFRKHISSDIERYENMKVKRLSGVVAATPHIRDRFSKVNKNCIDINNYPKKEDISFCDNWENREMSIGYIGGIFRTRGIFETLDAIEGTSIKLVLAGNFSPESLELECKNHPAWKNVEFLGYLERKGVNSLLEKTRLGMVILEATPSYLDSLPVKMFEYMAAGLPVIASDFPLWRSIIEKAKCGICVDQTNPQEIREKIENLISDTVKLKQMGINGRKAVDEEYNWEVEEKKLINFYKSFEKK
jgi:glycosyltransferase involved in cell wall biosynthesis